MLHEDRLQRIVSGIRNKKVICTELMAQTQLSFCHVQWQQKHSQWDYCHVQWQQKHRQWDRGRRALIWSLPVRGFILSVLPTF